MKAGSQFALGSINEGQEIYGLVHDCTGSVGLFSTLLLRILRRNGRRVIHLDAAPLFVFAVVEG